MAQTFSLEEALQPQTFSLEEALQAPPQQQNTFSLEEAIGTPVEEEAPDATMLEGADGRRRELSRGFDVPHPYLRTPCASSS